MISQMLNSLGRVRAVWALVGFGMRLTRWFLSGRQRRALYTAFPPLQRRLSIFCNQYIGVPTLSLLPNIDQHLVLSIRTHTGGNHTPVRSVDGAFPRLRRNAHMRRIHSAIAASKSAEPRRNTSAHTVLTLQGHMRGTHTGEKPYS